MQHNNPGSMRRGLRALIACALAGLILGGGVSGKAYAADEDDAIDVRVLRKVMRGLGLRRGDEQSINYHERSPLVVPPTLELPPPEDPTLAERDPAWPDDPDIRRAKQAAKRQRKAIDWNEEARALSPTELNRGVPRGGPAPDQGVAKTAEESERVSSPRELGFTGFKNLRSLFGFAPKEETAAFVEEPKRTDLTQPPPGYLTPAPSQPYGVGKDSERWTPKPLNPMDAAVGSAEEK
ncbi:MAG: hypothetical protein R3D62_14365 [Xanthobacteraceae bacterium]